MELTGKAIVERGQEELFELLMKAQTLRRCIPGCEELVEESPGRFRIELRVRVGMIKGRFKGSVELKEVITPESYTMEFSARGTTGSISGTNVIRLEPLAGGGRTEVHYEGKGSAGGGLAAVGGRLVEGAVRRFSEKFFKALAGV